VDDLLELPYGDRIDTAERLVEQDEIRRAHERARDFDAPPLNNFPGPEDHDGLGDGLFNNPPPPNPICVTVCPNNQPDPPGVDCVEVDLTANQYKQGIIVPVGPIYPDMLPPSGFEFWTAVVDPGHALADTNFSDNVLQFPELVPVRQCPDLSPDLLPTGTNVIPSRPNQFDDISFEVSILNQGEAPTRDSFDVDFYVDLPPVPVITFPTPSGQSPIPPGDCFRTVGPGLAIGQEITLPCTNFGGGPLNLAPGLHSVMVLVDSIGQFGIGTIVESDETNNVHPDSFFDPSSLFCVGSSLDGFGNPDLAISKIRFIDRNTRAIACDRKVDDVVDIELTIANRDVNPLARDLDISRHNSLQFYEVRTQATFGLPSLPACFSGSDIECTDLDGLTFDCVPLGPDRAPLVGQYKFPLIDTTLRVEVQRVDFSVPQDVDLTNNTVDVPLLNKPPVIDAGPAKAGTVGVPIRLAATASDPNDVPAGSQPLTLQWTVVSKPMGAMASFDQSSAEDPLFSGDKAGAYTLRLSGQDCATAAPVTDTVVVTLNPGPPGP